MISIRVRLLVALLALVAVASLLAGSLTYRRVLAETSELFDYQLRQMALSLRSQVSLAPRLELPPQQEDADFVVQIWNPFGARIYLSRPGLPLVDHVVLGYENLQLQGELWRVYGLQTIDGVIQIAQPERVREALARRAALHVAIPLLLLLPLLGGATFWVVHGSLLPLRRMAAEVQLRDVHMLTPVDADAVPEEVAPLIEALNRLLARLQAAFAVQRAFVADAAHELRSPLTALRIQLQLLDRAPDADALAQARAALGAAVERAIHLVEQLLTLARNEPRASGEDLQLVHLDRAVAAGMADAHALAMARDIDLSLDSEPDVCVRGDAESLRVMVRNLVDNAVRYTPSGGRVQVRLRQDAGIAVLEVIDSGPGIPAAERERAFDRFYRRAGAPEGGSGLGLAIVRAIADRHAASVRLDDAAGGGLAVTVRLPRVS
jgi:two-component system OmpR family sensor kinase/two-component system sensor histidine kinase QseC